MTTTTEPAIETAIEAWTTLNIRFPGKEPIQIVTPRYSSHDIEQLIQTALLDGARDIEIELRYHLLQRAEKII